MRTIEFKGIPTFRILDYQEAMNFYLDFLGFKIEWEHRFGKDEPVYMQVSRNNLTLHLSENKRFNTGVIIFVEATGIRNFYRELINKNPTESIPDILETDWNTLQMEIEDPFGNLMRFNEKR